MPPRFAWHPEFERASRRFEVVVVEAQDTPGDPIETLRGFAAGVLVMRGAEYIKLATGDALHFIPAYQVLAVRSPLARVENLRAAIEGAAA